MCIQLSNISWQIPGESLISLPNPSLSVLCCCSLQCNMSGLRFSFPLGARTRRRCYTQTTDSLIGQSNLLMLVLFVPTLIFFFGNKWFWATSFTLTVISGLCPLVMVTLQSWCLEGVPEDDVLQVKRVLYYTRGGNTDPQYILLGGNITLRSHTVYITKVTGDIHEQCG